MTTLMEQPAIGEEVRSLEAMDTSQLKKELARMLKVTAEHLVRLATVVRILEERGIDLSELKIGILWYLRKIACGQLLPEVVVKYQGSPSLLRRISNLPLPDQRRLLGENTIRLVVVGADGKPDVRLCDPLHMSGREVSQVFASDHLRSETEQSALLREATEMVVIGKKAQYPIAVDRKRGGIIVTGDAVFIGRKQLATLLSQIQD